MNKYRFSDKIYYFSIQQNNKVLTNNQSVGNIPNVVEESCISDMLDYLNQDMENYLIIDFSNIFSVSFKEEHYELFMNKKYALLGINDKYFNVIKEKAQKSKKIFNYKKYKISNKKSNYLIYFDNNKENNLLKFLNKFIPKGCQQESISTELSNKLIAHIVAGILTKDLEYYDLKNLKYLESSNVYVNCYLNVKRIFVNIDVLLMVINRLKAIIQDKFLKNDDVDDIENICLLGVSNNGIILSRILAYVMKIKVKSINHVGPKYCLNYDNSTAEQYMNKNYILVSDVICLGGEYRIAKGMISVLNSKLLGAVGIVKIRDIYRGDKNNSDKIYSIIDNINDYGCEYRVYIDREE